MEEQQGLWGLVMPKAIIKWLKSTGSVLVAGVALLAGAVTIAQQFGWGIVGQVGFWLTLLVVGGLVCLLIVRLWMVGNRLLERARHAEAMLVERNDQIKMAIPELASELRKVLREAAAKNPEATKRWLGMSTPSADPPSPRTDS